LVFARVGHRVGWGVPAAAICVLMGGLALRFGVVTTPTELLSRGPSAAVRFAPELNRQRGEPGADVGNRSPAQQPRSKLRGDL
jgi:hypothetical protein